MSHQIRAVLPRCEMSHQIRGVRPGRIAAEKPTGVGGGGHGRLGGCRQRLRRVGAPCSPCCGPTLVVGPSSACSWRSARRWRSPARSSCGRSSTRRPTAARRRQFVQLALLFLAIAVATQVVAVAVTWFATITAWGTTNELRLRITRHVLGLDHEFHRRHTPGELIQRVDGDVTSVSDFLGQVVPKAVGGVLLDRRDARRARACIDWRLGLGMAVYLGVAVAVLVGMRHRAVQRVVRRDGRATPGSTAASRSG